MVNYSALVAKEMRLYKGEMSLSAEIAEAVGRMWELFENALRTGDMTEFNLALTSHDVLGIWTDKSGGNQRFFGNNTENVFVNAFAQMEGNGVEYSSERGGYGNPTSGIDEWVSNHHKIKITSGEHKLQKHFFHKNFSPDKIKKYVQPGSIVISGHEHERKHHPYLTVVSNSFENGIEYFEKRIKDLNILTNNDYLNEIGKAGWVCDLDTIVGDHGMAYVLDSDGDVEYKQRIARFEIDC
ncbi:MAG: hypothetical protein FWC00_05850 [Firmicutes bacterium]|nr:hypothetical protein [Bacillota bacterium]